MLLARHRSADPIVHQLAVHTSLARRRLSSTMILRFWRSRRRVTPDGRTSPVLRTCPPAGAPSPTHPCRRWIPRRPPTCSRRTASTSAAAAAGAWRRATASSTSAMASGSAQLRSASKLTARSPRPDLAMANHHRAALPALRTAAPSSPRLISTHPPFLFVPAASPSFFPLSSCLVFPPPWIQVLMSSQFRSFPQPTPLGFFSSVLFEHTPLPPFPTACHSCDQYLTRSASSCRLRACRTACRAC